MPDREIPTASARQPGRLALAGEIIQRGRGKDMEAEGVRARMSI